jgi:DNA-binding response OmpR family regulator
LIVEDEPRIAHFLQQGLEQEGYAVRAERSGAAAMPLARSGQFDLIVLDWMLPDLDGLTLCRALRAAGVRTPVLMLTARDAVADRVQGLDGGADDYLTKPFEFEELLARLRSLLRRADAIRPPQLSVEDLVLDPAARAVVRGSRPVELTPREFALLEYLMRHAGRVLTRWEILQHVWGYEHDPHTNVVDVYVGYLRRKVDQNGDPPLLRTVPGVGYQLGRETGR